MKALSAFLSPQPNRSQHRDMLYAVCCLLAWLLLSAMEVDVAGSTSMFSLAIITDQGPFNWSIAPVLLGAFTLGLYWIRSTRYSVEHAPILQNRLQRFTILVFALCVVRLAALWHPLTTLFPALTLLWTPHATWAIMLGALGYIHGPMDNIDDEQTCMGRKFHTENRSAHWHSPIFCLLHRIQHLRAVFLSDHHVAR